MTGLQASLLDLAEDVSVGRLGDTVERVPLSDGAWIDVRRGWVTGSDLLFERLRDGVTWKAESRPMYERVVDVPRLLCFIPEGRPAPNPAVAEAHAALNAHYAAELGEPFATIGMCLYRDGRDSVAWHGDRIGRSRTDDTMVAILSVGAARALSLRPKGGGGPTVRYELGHGDLLVMGGSAQRTWEHAVLKTAKPCGPRISIQFRTRGVR